jgi:hypothetical protein
MQQSPGLPSGFCCDDGPEMVPARGGGHLGPQDITMFENLLRELNSLAGEPFTVSIPTDAEGYLDRECPNDALVHESRPAAPVHLG